MPFQSVDPSTGRLIGSHDLIGPDQINRCLHLPAEAFDRWRATPIAERRRYVRAAADRMSDRRTTLSRLVTQEMGKPIRQSESEIDFCVQILRYYADHGADFLASDPVAANEGPAVNATVMHEPIGALLGIMPWNFPFYQVIRLVAPNLMAGNTVLIKHAENVPRCALAVEEMFSQSDSDWPAGLVQNLFISTDQVESVIASKTVQGISLTGSNRAGAAVASLAGQSVKPVVLELGGDDPFVICDDIDLDEIVPIAADARLTNTGQSCIAAKRFIVADVLHDEFVERLIVNFRGRRVGDPMDPDNDLGPLCTQQARERLDKQVQSSRRSGTRVATGGKCVAGEGFYYEPTILVDITDDDPVKDQELFGPVAKVFRFHDDDEAVAIANSSRFGLGGSVHSGDVDRAANMGRRIHSGMVFVNAPCKSRCDLPFGGTKDSGYGRELGPPAIRQFVNSKLVVLPTKN